MQIKTRACVSMPAPIGRVFALATDVVNFPRYFKGSGPIPAVTAVEWEPGPRGAGGRRLVRNADGSVLLEVCDELTPPSRHRYRLVSGFKPPFSWLVDWAEGDWHFTPGDGATRVQWDYRFELKSALAAPAVLPIVKIFFRRAMQDCLHAMRDELARG
jgi:hypothetical protein